MGKGDLTPHLIHHQRKRLVKNAWSTFLRSSLIYLAVTVFFDHA